MIESVYRETANWNSATKFRVEEQNRSFRAAYEQCIREGLKNIVYIPSDELLGDDQEATIDGTHLTDVGFARLSDVIYRKLKELL